MRPLPEINLQALATIGVAMLLVTAVSGLLRPVQLPAVVTAAVAEGLPFDQRWNEMMEDIHEMERKLYHPRVIRTERIMLPDAPTPYPIYGNDEFTPIDALAAIVPLTIMDAPITRSIRKNTPPRDICAQHGRRKVMVGQYKWRCR